MNRMNERRKRETLLERSKQASAVHVVAVAIEPDYVWAFSYRMRRVGEGLNAGWIGKLAGTLAMRKRKNPRLRAETKRVLAFAKRIKVESQIECRARLANTCICGFCGTQPGSTLRDEAAYDQLCASRIDNSYRYERNGSADSSVYVPRAQRNHLSKGKSAAQRVQVITSELVWSAQKGDFVLREVRRDAPSLVAESTVVSEYGLRRFKESDGIKLVEHPFEGTPQRSMIVGGVFSSIVRSVEPLTASERIERFNRFFAT